MVDLKIFINLDGTIAGSNFRKSVWSNTLQLFKTGLKFVLPSKPWSILTVRPKTEKPLIKLMCLKYDITPEKIITYPSWKYELKDIEEICNWKNSILSSHLENSLLLEKYILYIDDDPDIRSGIITQKNIFVCSSSIINETINDLLNGRIVNV